MASTMSWVFEHNTTSSLHAVITLCEHFLNYRFSDVTWTRCSNYSCISNGTMLAPDEAVPRMQSTVSLIVKKRGPQIQSPVNGERSN